jgi:type I restriction enzyme S subunit
MNTAQTKKIETVKTVADSQLPEGWAAAEMGDIADIIGGGTPKAADAENFSTSGHAWITPADLSKYQEIYISKGARDLSDKGLKSCSATVMPPGSVLMSSRAPIGYVAIAAYPISTNQGFKSFVCAPGIVAEYIYFWLRFKRDDLQEMGSGTTFLEISGSRAKEIPILLAPIAEQKRLAVLLRDLLENAKIPLTRLHKSKLILKNFRQAVLAAACSGKLTEDCRKQGLDITPVQHTIREIETKRQELWKSSHSSTQRYQTPQKVSADGELPPGWEYVSSDCLFSFVTSGSRGWAKYYSDCGALFLRIGNLDHNSILLDLSNVQHVNPPAGLEGQRTRVRRGDILISITADVGMIGLVAEEIGPAYVNQHVSLARPVQDKYSRYLAWFLASDEAQSQFEALQRGATKVGLGLDDIRSIAVPFPPLQEQQEIVRRVEALFKLADTIEKRVGAATVRADKLMQAILAKAFRGELVSTEAELARREGREYEPASMLLKRIKAERENLKSIESHPAKARRPRGRRKAVPASA